MNKTILSLFISLFASLQLTAQCNIDQLQCNKSKDPLYITSKQSSTYMFDKEISHDFELELIDGNVYRISVCVENEKLKGSIPFEIFTKKIIMQYDQQNEKLKEVRKAILMYSNRDDNLSSKIEFQSAGTKNGFVRVFAPKLHNTNMHYSNCVGVFIQIQKEVGHEDD